MRIFCSTIVVRTLFITLLVLGLEVHAQASKNLAPGFSSRSTQSRIVIVPVDLELFSISAGGVPEPRADWTESAGKHFRSALTAASERLGGNLISLKEADLDELSEVNALHGAVAQSVFVHHMLGQLKLPTKNDALDWSLGDAIKPLHDKSGAEYALFFWVRDSYASNERKAAMVALALLGVGVAGGVQIGYSSLVDLKTGQVVWFNVLRRGTGDLRDAVSAAETVNMLLTGFPSAK